jgi:SAM-dependent methyltransferase
MHQSSVDKMIYFRDKHLRSRENESLTIVDIGSQDINGSYKPLFDLPKWRYIGVDKESGSNVDIVLENPYQFRGIKSESVDVVISGQAFEHVEYFWITMLEITRILKPGALCCLIVPSSGPQHRFPLDCWRFYPDGLKALAYYACLDVIEVLWDEKPPQYADGSHLWRDVLIVYSKPHLSKKSKLKFRLSIRVQQWAFHIAKWLRAGR